MKVLFITGVFENDATGASRFAKLIYEKGGDTFTILSEDTKGGNRIIKVNSRPKFYQTKLWQYFRIAHYRALLDKYHDEFDVFLFNNSLLAFGFESSKPCYTFVHDEKLMKVKRSFRFDFIRKHIFRRLERNVIESGINIISNSNYISKRISESYNIDPKNLFLLYQGIDLKNKRESYTKQLSNDLIQILFIKNDYLIGGLLELIQALILLENYKFKLTIIGTTSLTKNELQNVSSIDFEILGIRNNDEVVKLMYDHDILCIPARYEPLGVAVMEGLAVGIPTVTTGVGGLPEVTENGKHVWQCEPNNPKSIADQIYACLSNQELRKAKSRRGKEFVHQTFDFGQVIKRLDSIINS